ncbi:MAG: hypothetical protein MUC91_06220 [Verrucomicrobia bacterium]|jgi:hypothetical protein|nr:hypothetical protein [Verrucomicrobiota bacterium]
MSGQGELDFSGERPSSGLDRWREERRRAQLELARRLDLPLGHPVEVWLVNGIRLRGELRLAEERLFVDESAAHSLGLMVDGVAFSQNEIESCVRQD